MLNKQGALEAGCSTKQILMLQSCSFSLTWAQLKYPNDMILDVFTSTDKLINESADLLIVKGFMEGTKSETER